MLGLHDDGERALRAVKIDLLLEPVDYQHNDGIGPRPFPVRRMLPYLRTRNGVYIHRVRSALVHSWSRWTPPRTHISIRLWCGMSASLSIDPPRRTSELFAVPPEGQVVCATCEGRAVGAGFASSVLLAEHPVRFTPRRGQIGEKEGR